MIKVSEEALKHIAELRKQQGYDDSYGLRVSVVGGGCSGLSYKLDFDNQEQAGDHIVEDKGVKIFVNMKSLLYLVGTELDYSGGLSGKGFHFANPNASRTCACGESFSV
ncbi:MAG: iron-sulfur cluster assembly accessory protein [Bacteroidetes bacterium]|nr:MAG: iron-sulfur cluster assembly accessory protein [Bacteroidota bacterium]